jgi:predicted flap endonuclease-1-like 5' DNA nuclease
MNITFLSDHQSKETGNEFYRTGTRATLEDGAVLVAQGVAREGWGPVPIPPTAPEPVTPVTVEDVPDDLTRIKGIGARTAADLASFGVTTFAKLADGDAFVISDKLNGSSVSQVKGWQKQAEALR